MKLKKIVRENYFYPECFENSKQSLSDRIKVNISAWPSGAQIGTYKKFGFSNGVTTIDYDYIKMMLNHVESIENLEIGNDKIDTAVKLCDYQDARLYELITEIRDKILDSSEGLEQGED